MKVTLDLDDELLELAEREAEARGITLDDVVNEALAAYFGEDPQRPTELVISDNWEITLPPSLLERAGWVGWKPGDRLSWTEVPDGFLLRRIEGGAATS